MSPSAIPILAMVAEAQNVTDYYDLRGPDRMGVPNRIYAGPVLARYGLYADMLFAAGTT